METLAERIDILEDIRESCFIINGIDGYDNSQRELLMLSVAVAALVSRR